MQTDYKDLLQKYDVSLSEMLTVKEYLSKHGAFFDLYQVSLSVKKTFEDILEQSDTKDVLFEANAFSSGTAPLVDCIDELDKSIFELSRKIDACGNKYSQQKKESELLLSNLKRVRKILMNVSEYNEQKKLKEEKQYRDDMLRLEKNRLDNERAAQEREEYERKRENRIIEQQKAKELAIQDKHARAQEEANRLIKEALKKQKQQSCQPINLYVAFDQTGQQYQQTDMYVDQYGKEYQRYYSDGYDNLWVLYQLSNGMLYYACTVNGYEYYKDLYGNLIERPF